MKHSGKASATWEHAKAWTQAGIHTLHSASWFCYMKLKSPECWCRTLLLWSFIAPRRVWKARWWCPDRVMQTGGEGAPGALLGHGMCQLAGQESCHLTQACDLSTAASKTSWTQPSCSLRPNLPAPYVDSCRVYIIRRISLMLSWNLSLSNFCPLVPLCLLRKLFSYTYIAVTLFECHKDIQLDLTMIGGTNALVLSVWLTRWDRWSTAPLALLLGGAWVFLLPLVARHPESMLDAHLASTGLYGAAIYLDLETCHPQRV